MNKILLIYIMFFLSIYTFATEGVGLLYGNYTRNKNFSNINLDDAYYYGVFTYKTNYEDIKSGAFGMLIFDEDREDQFKGGFGGLITGREATYGPMGLGINIWGGIGYKDFSLGFPGVSGIIDLTGEVGLTLFPKLQLVLYVGIQGISTFIDAIESAVYSPVYGVKIVWGSFR